MARTRLPRDPADVARLLARVARDAADGRIDAAQARAAVEAGRAALDAFQVAGAGSRVDAGEPLGAGDGSWEARL